VLPKGKLYQGERALAAAKREVAEETGHEVSVRGFLGSMSYPVGGKIKIVQFWHMRAIGGPVRELAYEIKAVKWLPLKQAIETLSRTREKVFLASVGPAALKAIERSIRAKPRKSNGRRQSSRGTRHYSIAPMESWLAAGSLVGH
jgi:8-oxo-dGTP diphosphatase